MPSVFGLISIKYRTPMTSVVLAGTITGVFISIKNMDTLLNIAMLLAYIFNILCVIVLLHLRKTIPNEPRPFKVNLFFPIVFLILCTILTCMICVIFTKEAVLCLIFITSGLPVYYVCTKIKKPAAIQNKISMFIKVIMARLFIKKYYVLLGSFNVWAQKLTLSVVGEKDQ
jgi:amino acid transporter